MRHNQRKGMQCIDVWLFYTGKLYLIKLCLLGDILLHVVTFMF
jgi:hypothetical protein